MEVSSDPKQQLLIAVIDDNELSRRSIVEILEKENYDIAGSGNCASQALDILASKKPQIMLIDVIMPKTSGVELARTIMERQPDTNIIMMSSLNSQNIIIESISNGAIDFLKKPFTKETLIDSIEKIRVNLEKKI